MKRSFLLIICGVILVGCASSTVTPAAPSPAGVTRVPENEPELTSQAPQASLTTPELIDAALSRGEITAAQRLLYLAYAVYEPDSLPEEYRSNAPWRGTMIVKEIYEFTSSRDSFCSISVDDQQEFRRLIPGSVSCSP